jgi:hypothetical protein
MYEKGDSIRSTETLQKRGGSLSPCHFSLFSHRSAGVVHVPFRHSILPRIDHRRHAHFMRYSPCRHFFRPVCKRCRGCPGTGGDEGSSREWRTRGRFYLGWASIAISLVAAFLFGFIFFIPASFISYTLLLGRKQMFVKTLLLSLVTAVVVYIVFDRFLGIPTMRGLLWRR